MGGASLRTKCVFRGPLEGAPFNHALKAACIPASLMRATRSEGCVNKGVRQSAGRYFAIVTTCQIAKRTYAKSRIRGPPPALFLHFARVSCLPHLFRHVNRTAASAEGGGARARQRSCAASSARCRFLMRRSSQRKFNAQNEKTQVQGAGRTLDLGVALLRNLARGEF